MRQLILTLLTVLLIAPAVYAQDTMVPVLENFVVNTPVVDTSSGDATLRLTIRVQDDLSGVVQVLPNLFPPTGSIRSVACSLASGDVLDGIYDCTATIPQHAPTGTWEVRLGLEDSAGNAQILSADEIAALGFPSTFEVTHDSDGDGIADDIDACPDDNPMGLDADLDGCLDSPSELIALIEMLPNDALDETLKNSLIQKVSNANQQANKNNLCAAINILEAFQNAVEAQRGKKISDDTADLLNDYAANLITQFQNALAALGESCSQ